MNNEAISTVVDAQVLSCDGVSIEAKQFASETLGPMPKWDGYGQIEDQESAKRVFSGVGFIHAQAAEAGRNLIAIGQKLKEIKDELPHGQFMECVKSEFGWGHSWTDQLMQIADRFLNYHSSGNLPSSAKVLALLAAANADDATVQQAAEEQWTVNETKRRLGGQSQRERTVIDDAMSVLKISEEARDLALKAEHITTRQLMDELGLDDLPKGKRHFNNDYTFCKNGTGWWKFPLPQPVEVMPESEPICLQNSTQNVELLPLVVAAQRIGKKVGTVRMRLTPGQVAQKGYLQGNGWQVEPHPDRGMCLVRQIQDPVSSV